MIEEKTNTTEMQISQEIMANLRPNEKIIWNAKPVFHPITAFIPLNPSELAQVYFIASLICMPVLTVFILTARTYQFSFFIVIFLFIFTVFLFPFTIAYIVNRLTIKNAEYVLTNQRIIILRGAFSRYLKFIDLDKILHISVDASPFEQKYGIGSIYIEVPNPLNPSLQSSQTSGSAERLGANHGVRLGVWLGERLGFLKNPEHVHRLIKDAIEQNKLERIPQLSTFDAKIPKIQICCPKCKTILELPIMESNMSTNMSIVCPACNHTFSQLK